MGHHRLDPLGRMGEDLECDNGSRAVAKDGRRLVRQMLYQAPDIIGIGPEPVIIVLISLEVTPGKTAAVVRHHLIPCFKWACDLAENLPHAAGPWNQDQEWSGAAHL